MRRRELLTLVAATAVVSPFGPSWAQRSSARKIGLTSGYTADELKPLVEAFNAQMKVLGWTEGKDFEVQVIASGGNFDGLDRGTADLITNGVEAIVAMGTPGLQAVQRHTQTLPVVFTQVADPVGQKLVASLSHPEGNSTGLTNFEFAIAGKWLELLRRVDNRILRSTIIMNPANQSNDKYLPALRAASADLNVELHQESFRNEDDLKRIFSNSSSDVGRSIIVSPDSLPIVHRRLIVSLAQQHRIPTMYPFRIFPRTGGLVSYGVDVPNVYRQAAEYVDKIFRGARPADLPVQAPNKFELVINLKTAKSLGLTISDATMALADEVIE